MIHGITMEDAIDPACYELTYFVRHDEVLPEFDPEHPENVNYDESVRYSEENPLEGLPTEEGTYFVRIDGKAPYYGTSYVDFDVTEPVPENDFSKDVEIRFRGKEEWAEDYLLDSKEQKLSLDDLAITLVKRNGDVIPSELYELHFGVEVDYDDENHRPVIEEKQAPFGVDANPRNPDCGWCKYSVYAVAKDDSGYEGETRIYEFMVRDKHTLDRNSAYIDFGEEYLKNAFRSWHYNFEIPAGKIEAPEVYNSTGEKLDPSMYTLTYFERGSEDIPFDDPERYEKIYPEQNQLSGLPTEPGCYFARLDGVDPYYGTTYVDFDIVESELFGFENAEIRFDGKEEWEQDYYLNNKDEKLSLNDLNITVVKPDGEEITADRYVLHFGVEVDYDDENHCPVIEEKHAPFGVDNNPRNPDCGWCMYTVYAVAKDDSEYEGETRFYEFMIRDKHTLDRNSAYIDFGEEYLKNAFRSWHYNFEIPAGKIKAPEVYNSVGEKLDPSMYTLTYFERGEDGADFDELYSEEHPLGGMPTEPGRYFARLDGVDPYYGTTYVDFNILQSFALVRGEERRYYDGDTIYIPQGGEVDVCFDLDPYNGQIPGWRSDWMELFEVTYLEFDGDPYSYAHISAGELPGGTCETLYYNWLRFEDVFDENGGMHWDTAQPFMTCSVKLVVMPDTYDYLLGDADGDEEITIIDVTFLQRYLSELKVDAEVTVLMHGDVDADGELSIIDATLIQRRLANIRISFDVGKPVVKDV